MKKNANRAYIRKSELQTRGSEMRSKNNSANKMLLELSESVDQMRMNKALKNEASF